MFSSLMPSVFQLRILLWKDHRQYLFLCVIIFCDDINLIKSCKLSIYISFVVCIMLLYKSFGLFYLFNSISNPHGLFNAEICFTH